MQRLEAYFASHGLDFSAIQSQESQHRFVRLNPAFDKDETLQILKQEVTDPYPIRIPWLTSEFYALPSDFTLVSSPCFQQARLYGQDLSSEAAIEALFANQCNPQRVLDLCCAPGIKLCSMVDRLHTEACVVGVDCSLDRLAVAKKTIRKYILEPRVNRRLQTHIQLYHNDGTQLGREPANLVFDSNVAWKQRQSLGERKHVNKAARRHEQQHLEKITSSVDEPFDLVLVDAECSTDGSMKHVRKALRDDVVRGTMKALCDDGECIKLQNLQRNLLASGFRLLKPGGTLVYSTCSMSKTQNEDIVEWLLREQPKAELVSVVFDGGRGKEGLIKGTVRFVPELGSSSAEFSGGGFFIAKMIKKD